MIVSFDEPDLICIYFFNGYRVYMAIKIHIIKKKNRYFLTRQ